MKEAEQDGVAVGFAEFVQSFVNLRSDLLPIALGLLILRDHLHGSLLPLAAAAFGTDRFHGCKRSAAIEPAGQQNVAGQSGRFASQLGKHDLRDVARQMSIAAHDAQGRGINHIEVAVYQLRERGFGSFLSVIQ